MDKHWYDTMISRTVFLLLCTGAVTFAVAADPALMQPAVNSSISPGGWKKYASNPVLGGQLGTCFNVCVLKEAGKFRMWVSWRPKASIALVESSDGIHWSEPRIVLGPRKESGWEDDINRPIVLKRADGYHLWYTGQAKGHSWIGYATSRDGVTWKRMSTKPVLSPERRWEKVAVMCPHVVWDEHAHSFRMWYSGGEQNEPNAIGYATSPDGLTWTKRTANPIFSPDKRNDWEKDRVTACQVIRQGDWHVMLYIGFRDEATAQIGIAQPRRHYELAAASGESDRPPRNWRVGRRCLLQAVRRTRREAMAALVQRPPRRIGADRAGDARGRGFGV